MAITAEDVLDRVFGLGGVGSPAASRLAGGLAAKYASILGPEAGETAEQLALTAAACEVMYETALLEEGGGDSVCSFRAGDLTVRKNGSGLEALRRLRDSAGARLEAYLGAGFMFESFAPSDYGEED